jgi:hypothetical protein
MSLLHRTRDDDTAVIDGDRRNDDPVVTETTDHTTTDTAVAPATTKVRERTWTFAPGQLVSFAVGVGLVALGLVAAIRAGLDGNLARPEVDVLQLSHTAWLGLAEIALGVVLIIAGTGAWGRFLSVPIGAAMVIAGVLVLAEPDQVPSRLAMERDHGWLLVLLGALVALASMALPVWRTRKVHREGLDDTDDGHRRLLTH